jgi:hypothetical protein
MMNKGTIQTDHVADEFHAAITEFIERRDLRCMPGKYVFMKKRIGC